jgi:DNA primase
LDYYERLTLHFRSQLRQDSDPYKWLRNRGISEESIEKFHLGYAHNEDNGLERFHNSIAIPYLRPVIDQTKVASIRFRYLNPRSHKYDSMKGSKAHLFNVEATDAKDVYICEGEFDAIILTQLGFAAVGVPGAATFNPSWKYLFVGADTITLVFDSDETGEKGSLRIASLLGDVCPVIRRASLPQGTDVTDLYLKAPRELVRTVT